MNKRILVDSFEMPSILVPLELSANIRIFLFIMSINIGYWKLLDI